MQRLSREISKGLLRTLWQVALIGIILFLLFKIRSVFVYLTLALILTLIGSPIVRFFRDKLKFNKNWAVSSTIIIYLLFLAGFIAMFIPLISSQLENLNQTGLQHFESSLNQLFADVQKTLQSFGMNVDFKSFNPLSKIFSQDKLGLIVNRILDVLGSLSVGLGATFFITFLFLKDKAIFQYQFKKYILPDEHTDKILETLDKIEGMLSRYFIALGIQLLIFGFFCFLTLFIVGVKNALIISLICAILNIVPYIGPLIGNVLASVLTLLSFIDQDFSSVALPKAITVSIAFIVIQFLDNNFLQPYIFSSSVKSHPLEIFLVILIAGLLGGVIGMIIAIPLYTSIKVILKEFYPDNRIVHLFTKDI